MQRPGGLTAICVIAISLGALGACCNVWGLGSAAFQDRLHGMNRRMAEAQHDPGMREAQLSMQDEINEYTRAWMPVTTTLAFGGLILSILLVAGGALSLNYKSGGRMLLLVVCVAGTFFDVGRNVVEGIFSWRLQQIMARSMEHTMALAAAEHGGAAPSGMVGAAMGVGGALGFALMAAWVLVKLAYYVTTLVYVRKPEIRALYG